MEFPKGVEVVTAALIVNKESKVLLFKSSKWEDKWALPGGHVDPGEKLIDAAKREAEEETGLEVDVVKFLRFGELIGDLGFHRPAHLIYFHFLCKAKKGSQNE